MVREVTLGLLLLSAGLPGCSSSHEPHSESIPNIPPGRASVEPERGEQMPVAPPAKQQPVRKG